MVRSSEAESATRTWLFVPLKLRALPKRPWVVQLAPDQGARVPIAGGIGGGGAGSLGERPGPDQARGRGRSGAGGGLGDGGIATEVAGGIDRPDLVAVGGRGRQAGVAEGGGGGRPHLGEVGAARALAALDPVAGDADVVGGGGPAQPHLAGAGGGRGQPRGVGRRRGVGTHREVDAGAGLQAAAVRGREDDLVAEGSDISVVFRHEGPLVTGSAYEGVDVGVVMKQHRPTQGGSPQRPLVRIGG